MAGSMAPALQGAALNASVADMRFGEAATKIYRCNWLLPTIIWSPWEENSIHKRVAVPYWKFYRQCIAAGAAGHCRHRYRTRRPGQAGGRFGLEWRRYPHATQAVLAVRKPRLNFVASDYRTGCLKPLQAACISIV